MAKKGQGDIADILAQIQNEKQRKDLVDHTVQQLTQEVAHLEKNTEVPLEELEEEMEWKTRHDIQADVNKMLNGRIKELQEKLDDMKQSLKTGQLPQVLRRYDDSSDSAIKKLIRDMEREMTSLTSELKHLEFRLDQESQQYHKADDERKKVQVAIEQLKRDMTAVKRRNTLVVTLGADMDRPMEGLPRNRRILNPRLGPVKSSAVVNRLPRLPVEKRQARGKKGKSPMKTIPEEKKGKRRARKYNEDGF